MRLITVLLLIFAILIPSMACAQELRLHDGTVIQGNLISFNDGVYTFSSQGLGTMLIPASKVAVLSNESQAASPSQEVNQAKFQQIQSQLMADPEVMQLLEALQNDPDILAILADPEIMQAVQNRDFKGLENNPKLQKVMEKSQFKAIKQKYEN